MSALELPLHQTVVSSTASGIASTLLGHPIDTLKVHIQTNPALLSIGATAANNSWVSRFATIRAARHLLQSNGYSPLVFFRGIGPPIVNAVVMNVATFTCFNQIKEQFATRTKNEQGNNNATSYLSSLTAGIVSGFVTACISTPTDYVKIQSQLRGISSAAILKEIFAHSKNNVIQSTKILFRGNVSNLGREGVFTMVYLGLYDVAMNSSKSNEQGTNSRDQSLAKVAAISSITGGLAWIACYPFDTIKSVMQGIVPTMSRMSIPEAIRRIHQYTPKKGESGGGYSAFYRGCGASTGRAVLVTSSRMIVLEWVAKTLFGAGSC